MNCKAKGNRAERKTKALLVERGYQLVMKSGKTIDLSEIFHEGIPYFFEVKTLKGRLSPCQEREIEALQRAGR
jgi:hypothetical protein